MKLGAIFGNSTPAVGAAAGGVIVVVGAVVGYTLLREDPAQPGPEAAPETVVSAEVSDSPAPIADPQDPPPPEAVASAPTAAPQPEPEAEIPEAPIYRPPSFDQVRVAPDGNTVIAGRAPARSEIEVRLDGAAVSATRADGAGAFAALLSLPPSDQPRILTLVARIDGQEIAGADQVIVAPFSAPEAIAAADLPADAPPAAPADPATATPAPTAPAATSPEAGTPEAALAPTAPAATSPEPAAPDAAQPDVSSDAPNTPASAEVSDTPVAPASVPPTAPAEATPTAPAAPAVVIAGPDGLRISRGGPQPPDAQTDIQIDAISYDTEGAVFVSGRGTQAAELRVYLNNQPIRMGEIGPGGTWSLALPDVDPGTYTLRVTQLGPEGEVASETETPFLREDPARVAQAPTAEDGVSVITVQPGFTLWGIAEANFGEGLAYVQIFEENRDQIRDPHWIFPGQIFRLPDLPGAEDPAQAQ